MAHRDLAGPLGDLTGTGDQPSGKVVHWDLAGPLGDVTGTNDQSSGKVVHRDLAGPLCRKSPKTEHQLMSFLGCANYYRECIKGYADKVYPMQQLMRHKGKKFTWNNAAEESFQRIKKELCEAPVLGMPTEKGMYVLVIRYRTSQGNNQHGIQATREDGGVLKLVKRVALKST